MNRFATWTKGCVLVIGSILCMDLMAADFEAEQQTIWSRHPDSAQSIEYVIGLNRCRAQGLLRIRFDGHLIALPSEKKDRSRIKK